jgi:hypothetical protein
MCMGGGGDAPATPRVDPAPTVVQPSDVQADSGKNERKERRRIGRDSNVRAEDRNSILGSLLNGDNSSGTRNRLG